jgi:hypothetical protein
MTPEIYFVAARATGTLIVSTFALSKYHERGVFCQVSMPGSPGIDGIVCGTATTEVKQKRSPERTAFLPIRAMNILSSVKMHLTINVPFCTEQMGESSSY